MIHHSLCECEIKITYEFETNLISETRMIPVALAGGSTRFTVKVAPVTVMMPMNCSSFGPADKAWKVTRRCEQSARCSDTVEIFLGTICMQPALERLKMGGIRQTRELGAELKAVTQRSLRRPSHFVTSSNLHAGAGDWLALRRRTLH